MKGNTELSAETQHITPLSCLTTPPKPLKQIYWHITKPSATFIYPVQSRLVTSHITMECGWWWRCFSFFIVITEILYLCACWGIRLVRFSIVVFANRNKSKTVFIVPTDAHYYKIIEMLKQFKIYNTCSDMFRFMQKPSSGSSPVLS